MGDMDSDSSASLHTIEDTNMEDPNSNFNRPFNYVDWDSCPSIIKAVVVNDINAVQHILLKKPIAINWRDQLNNTALHMAYMHQNLEILNILLTHPDIDLESKNYEGETPLMKSIGKTSDAVIIKLLDAGCDMNTQDSVGRNPLHVALNFQRTIVEELLKRGADLNAPCGCGGPALFHAINMSSLEFLCMLLYYNADTSIKNDEDLTPFLYSLNSQYDRSIAYELFPYVTDFTLTDLEGLNSLSLALNCIHPIAMDILPVMSCETLNKIDQLKNCALYYAMYYTNTKVFKELFSKMDHNLLLKCEEPILENMLAKTMVHNSKWLECFYILASSDVFPKLLNKLLIYLDRRSWSLFTMFLSDFTFELLPQNDREKIIYIFLSYGARVFYDDILIYYNYFGLCKEINIFLSFKICGKFPAQITPFLSYIFGQEVRQSYSDLKRDIINELNDTRTNLLPVLRYFTFLFTDTQELIQNKNVNVLDIGLVPSLLELSRNEVRFKVRSDYGITTTSEFYDIVDKLFIPTKIKNYILFKTPIR